MGTIEILYQLYGVLILVLILGFIFFIVNNMRKSNKKMEDIHKDLTEIKKRLK